MNGKYCRRSVRINERNRKKEEKKVAKKKFVLVEFLYVCVCVSHGVCDVKITFRVNFYDLFVIIRFAELYSMQK